MSTRSLIAVRQQDKTIKAVYCHFDGYPSCVGSILFNHYNSEEKANELVALGNLSSLGEKPAPEKEFDKPSRSWWKSGEPVRHSYETPQDGVTVAYHRDRGEKLHVNHFQTKTDMRKWFNDSWCDYLYLFENRKWYCQGRELGLVLAELENENNE